VVKEAKPFIDVDEVRDDSVTVVAVNYDSEYGAYFIMSVAHDDIP
jgi:hypothetical protein